jgi:hypothetical protein
MHGRNLLNAAALLALAMPGMGGPFKALFGHGKLVTDAPYSAALSNQMTRHLSDGNAVQRTTTGQVARDSQGRTYEQVTITGGLLGQTGTRTLTFISDPVAGFVYTLDSSTKIATQRPLPANGEREREGKEWKQHSNGPNVVESDLPSDSSSGVLAEGKSITRTTPAGAAGNAQPIVATTQTWYSPELQTVVKSIRNDPFIGQSTYSLTNIVTKEPDALLFKVPADYTVKPASELHGSHGYGIPDTAFGVMQRP